jgi:hypothetical protein
MFSAHKFSRDDITTALHSVGIDGLGISATAAKNRVMAVRFEVWNGQRWVNACRFMSVKVLLRAKASRLVERSKTVQFRQYRDGCGVTDKGYMVTLDTCQCRSFGDDWGLEVLGQPVCKHQAQLAKVYFGAMNFSQLVIARETKQVIG